jgi:rare lipoprotein A
LIQLNNPGKIGTRKSGKYGKHVFLISYLVTGFLIIFSTSCSPSVRYAAKTKSAEPAVLRQSLQNYHQGQILTGKSSYYGPKFHGRKTANGEIFDMYKLTAAHRDLPFETLIRVTNIANNKSVVVHVNDRGPFVAGRILDLSYGAAQKIEMINAGVASVKIEIIRLGTN